MNVWDYTRYLPAPTEVLKAPARVPLLMALAVACAALCHAPSAWAASPKAEGLAPIKVGAVSSLTGPAPFPEATEAVRAYFDVVNAAGGIKGRKLQFIAMDDRGDPAAAKAAAKALVEDQRVVAHVGSSSIVDCTANAEYYRSQGIISIQGTGVEPSCFASSQIAPVNTGAYLSMRNALQFAVEVLQARRPCVFIFDIPGMRPAYEAVIAQWTQASKIPLAAVVVFRGDEDPKTLVQQAVQSKCDAVAHGGIEPMVIAWVQASRSFEAFRGVPQIFLTPAYTAKVASTLATPAPGSTNEKVYAMAEFEPWSSRSGSLSDWKSVMQKGKVPLSSFSQGGYTAAQVFVKVLQTIPGEITRDSIAAAFRKVEKLEMPMAGTPFAFGTRVAHNPNRATLPVKLSEGAWRIAHPAWIVAPE